MIRLRRLQPDTVRGIRHWAIELAVVVVGVLLALWVAEWAENRREARADALAEAAVREELAQNMATVAMWTGQHRCYFDQALHIRGLLLESGQDWPGVERMTLFEEPRPNAFPFLFRTWSMPIRFDAWEAAASSGAVERMSPEKRRKLSGAYQAFEVVDRLIEQANETQVRLGGLSYPQQLTDDRRSAALSDLVALVRAFNNIHDRYPSLDFGATSQDIAAIEGHLRETEAMIGPETEGIRDCLQPLLVPAVLLEGAE